MLERRKRILTNVPLILFFFAVNGGTLSTFFSFLAMNINLPDFYLGLWGFSAKYLGGKTLVHKGPELLIIKEKNVFGKTIYYSTIVVKLELTITS